MSSSSLTASTIYDPSTSEVPSSSCTRPGGAVDVVWFPPLLAVVLAGRNDIADTALLLAFAEEICNGRAKPSEALVKR
jgi:hypothetical protein